MKRYKQCEQQPQQQTRDRQECRHQQSTLGKTLAPQSEGEIGVEPILTSTDNGQREQCGQVMRDEPPATAQREENDPLTEVPTQEKMKSESTVPVPPECNTDGADMEKEHCAGRETVDSLKFVVGGVVRLIGLRRAEFNDQRGTVVASAGEKEDRVSVQLENAQKVLLVKRRTC